MKHSVEIREASFADSDGIIALLARHKMELGSKRPEEFRHIWENNPAVKDCGRAWPMGWVLRNDEGRIAGFIGNIPVAYQLNGRRLLAACMSSWAVDEAYRKYSTQLIFRYLRQKSADILLNPNTSNAVSYKFFTAFKTREVFKGSYDRVFFWITDYRHFAASVLKSKHIPFSNFFNFPLSLLQFLADKCAGENRCIKNSAENVCCIPFFDERFDIFWRELEKTNGVFLCVRDRKSLNWHFNYALLHKKIWIFIIEKHSRITSYAIFSRQDNPEIGLRRMRLVDFQTVSEDNSALKDMISYAVKKCREEKIDVLEASGFNPEKRRIFMELAPVERRLTCRHFFYRAKDASLAKELENPALWDPCLFDSDASL